MADDQTAGALVLNADDWGLDRDTTDRTRECIERGSISSVSAMVFMADSERAAAIARESAIDAALHLNFTTPFSAPGVSDALLARQQRLTAHLRRHRLAPVVFHPGLARSFEYVVNAQLDEYCRLYGAEPARIDGHHHMHLCTNVVLGGLLPAGTVVRRNFTFRAGEKGRANRVYRALVDRLVRRRHRIVDYLFTLPPLEPLERLQRIVALARHFVVEVEAHPVVPDEFRFLTGGEMSRLIQGMPIARGFDVGSTRHV